MDAAKPSPPKKSTAKSGATGPKGAAGKAKSSSNALTHGATSKRWLTEPERQAFETNLAELRAHYPSSNPLVKMQLERIAGLKVQLERIQDVIDASFAAARARTDSTEEAIQVLKLSDTERVYYARRLLGHQLDIESFEYLKPEVLEVAAEVTESDRLVLLTTHDDFLLKLPLFCAYIVQQAQERGISLAKFVESRQLLTSFEAQLKAGGLGCLFREDEENKKSELTSVSVATLRRCADWFAQQLSQLRLAHLKFGCLEYVAETIKGEVTPDLDKLDHLMRYQTTINRQLSSAVGELLALTKV